MLMLIETVLTVAAFVLSVTAADLGSHSFERLENIFRTLGRRQTLSILIVAMSALAARAVVFPVLPVPVPQVDDEFSHLLLADTLLHGRLANPTPAMWVHLETLEVNMKPTYASVYPPMQGTFLAAGRLLTGQPFGGVMLSVAVMCGAICWMLQGWMPGEWALLGGLLAVMRFGIFGYWADGFMGGAPAAIGGALALGAVPRIKRDFRARDAVILGLGFSILANSRPYEGFVLSAVIGVTILYWLLKEPNLNPGTALARLVTPLIIVVTIGAVATGYYFWRVTGNPLRTPYQVNWETYGMMPKFVWQSLRAKQAPALRHEALKDFYYVWEYATYASTRTAKGLLTEWAIRLEQDWVFYLGPTLSLPLIVAVATVPYGFGWKKLDANTRFLFLTTSIFGAGVAVEMFSFPHYAAPITCAIIAFVLLAMRYIRTQKYRGKPFGLFLTRAIPVVCLIVLVLRAAATPLHIPLTPSYLPTIYNAARADIPSSSLAARLESTPGEQLVIVHYLPGSEDWMGWVHNDADIDHSKIVWAWDMGNEKNRELVEYFRGRRVWLVNAGDHPPQLTPFVDETGR